MQRIERPADDVAVLFLSLPANERLQFLAGQYVEIILRDGKRRAYSMANSPEDDTQIELHVRSMPGGTFTDYVFNRMKEKDILRFEGPLGTFFLREDSDKPIIFVASGTGFAPVKSILLHAFRSGVQRQMVLYWGGRRPKDIYMAALCQQWQAEHDNFSFIPVVSEALPEDQWQGRTGFVHRAAMEDFPDLSGYQVYACGAPIVVESAHADFTSRCQLPDEEFFSDAFTPAPARYRLQPEPQRRRDAEDPQRNRDAIGVYAVASATPCSRMHRATRRQVSRSSACPLRLCASAVKP